MLDPTKLLTFSHTHCLTICAVLVPLNLLATLQTIVLTALHRPRLQVRTAITLAGLVALAMILHVLTWFVIGVVMIQTYILLSLGGVCLLINLWAGSHPASLNACLQWLLRSLSPLWHSVSQRPTVLVDGRE